jgi:hypothetical protein
LSNILVISLDAIQWPLQGQDKAKIDDAATQYIQKSQAKKNGNL